jgi:beta-lactamase class A
MDRRSFGVRAAATLAGLTATSPGWARYPGRGLDAWLRWFKSFPGTTSFRIDIDGHELVSDAASSQLFVASAIKTFILCQFLRDVEAGVLDEDEQLAVNDAVRAPGSPVFGGLTGTTAARSVLEAMIAHSDNTATDIALNRVGPQRVRALIAEQGLAATRIPDSTRRFFSYNVGAPFGVDIGWSGVQDVLARGRALGPPHRPLNDQETLASSADDLVEYYKRALAGSLFTKRTTLPEFKRILLSNTFFPEDTVGYGKGGSGDWVADSMEVADFHAISFAGQMVVGATPVTFCFVVNWTSEDPKSTSEDLIPAFVDVVKGTMGAIKQMVRR